MSSRSHNVVALRPRYGEEPWVTPQRLADYFGVSTRTVQRWKAEGLPCLERRGVVRFRCSVAESWLRDMS